MVVGTLKKDTRDVVRAELKKGENSGICATVRTRG